MMAPEHVLLVAIEIDALHEVGVIDSETHRRSHDYIERHRSEIAAWLDTPMKVSDAADLVVERAVLNH